MLFCNYKCFLLHLLLISAVSCKNSKKKLSKKQQTTQASKFDYTQVIEVDVQILGPQVDKKGNCGGTIISKKHVLTAAHCFFQPQTVCSRNSDVKEWRNALYPINQTMVQVDGTCLPGKIPCPSKESQTRGIGVKSVYIPQLYVDSHCDKGDIAIIELKDTIKQRKVVLQRSNKYPSVMFTSGYGFDPNVTVDRPDSLMTANVTIQACPKDEINDDIICSEEIKQNACQGDSGAGLRDINANLYGIVSYGTSCSHMYGRLEESKYLNQTLSKDTFKGGVFTKVASYMPFICKVTKLSEKKGCLPEDKKITQAFLKI